MKIMKYKRSRRYQFGRILKGTRAVSVSNWVDAGWVDAGWVD